MNFLCNQYIGYSSKRGKQAAAVAKVAKLSEWLVVVYFSWRERTSTPTLADFAYKVMLLAVLLYYGWLVGEPGNMNQFSK